MPAERFNCYLCGEKIAAGEDSKRVERKSLILWAHARCLESQKKSAPKASSA